MRDPMIKRIPRELRHDIGQYIALFLFLTVMIGFISGFIVGDESLKARYDTSFDEFKVEDGHFVLEKEPSSEMLAKVRGAGTEVWPLLYKEETIQAPESEADGDVIRVYKVRTDVDLTDNWEGRDPERNDEISLDRLYLKNNGLKIGDSIMVAGNEFIITGSAALSDYSALFRNNGDTMFDATDFTVALVTQEGFDRIRNSGLHYCYAWRNNERLTDSEERHEQEENVTDALIDAAMEEMMIDPDPGSMITAWMRDVDDEIAAIKNGESLPEDSSHVMDAVFMAKNGIEDLVVRSENQAIKFAGDDMGKDRVMMVTLLYIVIVIMAFVFGITVKSSIEKESKAIGTLRASGYSRGEMLRHYITLPVALTLASALAGNVIGYTFMKWLCADMYLGSYSLLPYKTKWSINAFRDTTVVPLIIIFLVVLLVIYRELRLAPLKLLRGESAGRSSRHAVKLRSGSFITRFRTRVLIQNLPSYIVMFFGILFSVIIMLFCLGMYPLLQNYEDLIMDSGMSEYQYILKEPYEIAGESTKGEGESDGAPQPEKYQIMSVRNDDSRREEITVYGLKHDSGFLTDLDIPENDDEVVVSSAYAAKYGLEEGSSVTVKEEYKKERYRLKVASIYPYEAQLCIFMGFPEFNRVFGRDRGEYAGYLSDYELTGIPESKIAAVITKEDYATISKQLDSSMGGIFELFSIFGVVIFVIVIYLLSRVLIEKNARNIAMTKILGYSDGEISSVYNRVTTVVVFVSLVICLPIGYVIFAGVFRIMMLFFTGWLTYYIAPSVYVKILIIGMASYLIVHVLQMRNIARVPMGEVLKGME